LDEQTQKSFIQDLLQIALAEKNNASVSNFQTFLRSRFGDTLYKLYFEPYNKKVWRRELSDVPIDWLAGKLPMPTTEEIIYNNFNRVAEKQFVHSTFYYEKQNGSQFLADRLAEGLDIRYNADVTTMSYANNEWTINGEIFDAVVFCGNIKDIPNIIQGVDLKGYIEPIEKLQSHGTTSVFCEIDANPYSWMYLPDEKYRAHRIICTGNFSPTNNGNVANGRTTATVEFTDEVGMDEISDNLQRIPLHPIYITHKYNQYTYPIQQSDTREMISSLKQTLSANAFYMTGRFADWEYYNMDAAIAAAMKVVEQFLR
jgi:protoporphyrinogen oxidase